MELKMLNKIVNGQQVQCTPEEEAEIRAEWAANEAKALEPQPPTLEEIVAQLQAEVTALKEAKL